MKQFIEFSPIEKIEIYISVINVFFLWMKFWFIVNFIMKANQSAIMSGSHDIHLIQCMTL